MIRLLVLLSGHQPYAHQAAAWRSFKSLVGPTVVTITGLSGPYSIAQVQLTPERWPAEPDGPVGDWVGDLLLDGVPAAASELFAHLDVVHLVGTERLGDTLELQHSRLAAALRLMQVRLRELDDQRADFGAVAEELDAVSPRRAEQEHVELLQVRSDLEFCAARLEELSPRVEDLAHAAGLRALLESGDAAEQEQRLKELRDELEGARRELAESGAAHEAAVAALTRGSKAQREAAKAERQLRGLSLELDDLAARQEALRPRLERAGIDPALERLDEPNADKLSRATEQAATAQRAARFKAALLSRSEAENDLIDELRIVLDSAIERGLSGLRVAALHDYDVTVVELRDALGQVNNVGTFDLEELAAANAAASELNDLAEIFRTRTALVVQADKARSNLEGLEQAISGHDELREQARLARVRLDAATTKVRSLNMQIGAMTRSGLAGADVADARARVAELLARHGVPEEGLAGDLAQAQVDLAAARSREKELRGAEGRLGDQAARRRVLREQVRARALRDPKHRWLADLAAALGVDDGKLGEGAGAGADWPDATWQALANHLAQVRVAFDDLVRDVGGLESVARTRGTGGPYRPALRSVIERDALEQFAARPIAEALFDGGEVQRVNFEEQTITWKTRSGEIRTRPLDAFSSGEQALGFMRAKLEQVAAKRVQNRLIFLDEFGAFIAADRRRPLAELLTNDDLLGLADHVVVVLPLQADYEAELDQTTGALHETYQRRATAVAASGYFTEVFDR
ncbi:hypothetical protein M3693_12450 [Cellulosimicrobium funkei]|uniref:hypothetical protein n=1 Tax=Cellulosimicrobium funkei TaxID=264251 RepID=UPI00203D9536|nr:hypothetical protein [Cellulosimicrobium funkei]MCM3535026.1 hypothetical protein [Cellulosimicrobium funkei]